MNLLRKSNFVRIPDFGPDSYIECSYFENGPKSEIQTSENELLRTLFWAKKEDSCVPPPQNRCNVKNLI